MSVGVSVVSILLFVVAQSLTPSLILELSLSLFGIGLGVAVVANISNFWESACDWVKVFTVSAISLHILIMLFTQGLIHFMGILPFLIIVQTILLILGHISLLPWLIVVLVFCLLYFILFSAHKPKTATTSVNVIVNSRPGRRPRKSRKKVVSKKGS